MILIAGATGFVGRALLDELAERDRTQVRALVRRDFDAVRLRDRGIDTVTGDLVTGAGLDPAMRGVKTLVYLAHTADRPGDLVDNDLTAVQNATLAARAAGVERIVYLGPIAASEEATSRYLVARWAVELAVRQSGIQPVILRSSIIVGGGGTLFEMMRRFVNRSPIVPLFAWRRVAMEPIALGDVVQALCLALDGPELADRSFDLCGAERITIGEMVRGWGRAAGKHRIYLSLPGYGEALTEQLAWTLARLPRRKTRLLIETLREPQICTDLSQRFPLPQRPMAYRQALAVLLGEDADDLPSPGGRGAGGEGR
ncbi:MAG TPA: NAD(P)H-binding protein [Dehalococcoidia bacterium]|jgi:uncharacterized protein YbjT (DUF2867 family)|nr:NAD(P)H-binding protein [Dehalococcoidia bacterium]